MATAADADLILKLYDLRREAVCRQARAWFINWHPADEGDIKSVLGGAKAQENAYLRQTTTYWEMAFSLVNAGAIDAELFAKNCGEGLLCAVKCQHLKGRFPAFTRSMPEAEAFIAANAAATKKAEMFRARFA